MYLTYLSLCRLKGNILWQRLSIFISRKSGNIIRNQYGFIYSTDKTINKKIILILSLKADDHYNWFHEILKLQPGSLSWERVRLG